MRVEVSFKEVRGHNKLIVVISKLLCPLLQARTGLMKVKGACQPHKDVKLSTKNI